MAAAATSAEPGVDSCRFCKQDTDEEVLLQCDGCGKYQHTYCLKGCLCGCGKKPPGVARGKTDVPEGDWFCIFCAGRAPKPEDPSKPVSDVFAWGCNQGGQLGLGSSGTDVFQPTLVTDLAGVVVKSMGLGGWNSTLLTEDGTVYSCGDGNSGKTGHADVVHELLTHFARIPDLDPENLTSNSGSIQTIAAGRDFVAAISTSGHMYTWGSGEQGRLGHQDYKDRKRPTKVSALRETEVPISSVIGCGWGHTVCTVAPFEGKDQFTESGGGEVLAWGQNSTGCLGSGDPRPQWVPKMLYSPGMRTHTLMYNPTDSEPWPIRIAILSIACGRYHTLFLAQDATVWSCGAGSSGQLGRLDPPAQSSFMAQGLNAMRPGVIPKLSDKNVAAIYAGADSSMARTLDGKLFVWGANSDGQLGLGDETGRFYPEESVSAGGNVADAGMGDRHILILRKDGSVHATGSNMTGQLGQPKETSKSKVFVPVAGLPARVDAIFVGGDHNFAVVNHPGAPRPKRKTPPKKAPKPRAKPKPKPKAKGKQTKGGGGGGGGDDMEEEDEPAEQEEEEEEEEEPEEEEEEDDDDDDEDFRGKGKRKATKKRSPAKRAPAKRASKKK